MRFVLAIVTFVVAAALIGLGIAQRTVWSAPTSLVTKTTITTGAPFTVIDGKVLNAHPGRQTLLVRGAKSSFVAYGRTADVKAWLGHQEYSQVHYREADNTLTAKKVTPKHHDDSDTGTATPTPTPTATPSPSQATANTDAKADAKTKKKKPGPNPVGSDLWLEQFVGADAAVTKMNVPDSISIIIASDGTAPAPKYVQLVWPLDDATPWSGPLILGGGLLLVVGLVLYLFALRGMRRARGPRRSAGPPPPPTPGISDSSESKKQRGVKGTRRRALGRGMVAVPVVVIGSLVFTGCSAEYWPQFPATQTPTATTTPLATDIPGADKDVQPPAVTGPQLNDIVNRIAGVAKEADAKLSTDLIETRFTGAALAERKANYAIRTAKADAPAPQAIPAGPVVVGLPQATDSWPRVVSSVVKDSANAKSAPIDLVMVQKTPRDNYHVEYAVTLEADATVPDLAPTNIGASLVPPDSKLLTMSPSDLGEAYSDVLMNGSKSKYADDFDEETDDLSKQVGADYKAKQIAALPKTAQLTYTTGKPVGEPVAMATNDSGALVATSVTETATVKPVEAGAKVGAGSITAALTGVDESTTGLATTYGYQLLFYVPPADSKQKIRLLGFTQSPISAKEL